MRKRTPGWPVSSVLTVAGTIGLVGCTVVVLRSQEFGALLPIGLAACWFVAGWVATRARPEHVGAQLLLAVGAAHLVAYSSSGLVSLSTATGWLVWSVAVVANLCFAAGFGALTLVLALFPDGRPQIRSERVLVRVVLASVLVVTALPALTSSQLDLVAHVRRSTVPAPGGLPVGGHLVDLFPLMPLLVLTGLCLCIARGRRAQGELRQVFTWPAGAGSVVVLLLLVTPVAAPLLGGRVWAVVFVGAVGTVPFALLAGIARYRLLAVDLFVTRTVARGLLAIGVLCLFGLAAAALGDDHAPRALAAAVAVLAALTGTGLRRWLESLVDRLVTGGRVRRAAAARELTQAVEDADPDLVSERVVAAVRAGLEVSWVRLVLDDRTAAEAGDPGMGANRDPSGEVAVPLSSDGVAFGALECGPRHGGWRPEHIETLTSLANQVALVLANVRLTAALGERVTELEASRRRLVEAEEVARRHLERDLHDGVQQQLVALLARLETLRTLLPSSTQEGRVIADAHLLAQRSLSDLRDLVRGIYPPLLADRGLVAALQSQMSMVSLPVKIDVDPPLDTTQHSPEVEAAAYFVVLEAVTNVVKHAGATRARIVVTPTQEGLTVAVIDEGRGFDDVPPGTGLSGMRDRVEALGGWLSVTSAPGVGTTVVARLPSQVGARA